MLWIEQLSRQKDVVMRTHVKENDFTIGRAYYNAVIVDDPYVSPKHLRITQDVDGAVVASDLNTKNGMFDNEGARQAKVVLTGNTVIRIGQTYLRVRDAGFEVPIEQRLEPRTRLMPVVFVLMALTLFCMVLPFWLHATESLSAAQYFQQILPEVILIALWVGMWGLLSRLFSGEASIPKHSIIAFSGVITTSLLSGFLAWFAYAFSSEIVARYSFPVYWLIVAALLFAHLIVVSNQRRYQKLIAVAAFAVCGCALQILMHDILPFQTADDGPYLEQWYPPGARVLAPKTETQFFIETQGVKDKLEAMREEKPNAVDVWAEEESN
jgi:pSer/pThr/pTyr-binding forkhead associated (FHA) protein